MKIFWLSIFCVARSTQNDVITLSPDQQTELDKINDTNFKVFVRDIYLNSNRLFMEKMQIECQLNDTKYQLNDTKCQLNNTKCQLNEFNRTQAHVALRCAAEGGMKIDQSNFYNRMKVSHMPWMPTDWPKRMKTIIHVNDKIEQVRVVTKKRRRWNRNKLQSEYENLNLSFLKWFAFVNRTTDIEFPSHVNVSIAEKLQSLLRKHFNGLNETDKVRYRKERENPDASDEETFWSSLKSISQPYWLAATHSAVYITTRSINMLLKGMPNKAI